MKKVRLLFLASAVFVFAATTSLAALNLHTARVSDTGAWILLAGMDNELLFAAPEMTIYGSNLVVTNSPTNIVTNRMIVTNVASVAKAEVSAGSNTGAQMLPFIGIRWAPVPKVDVGIRNWGYGAFFDFNYQFSISSDNFYGITLGAGAGATWVPSALSNSLLTRFSPALVFDIRMFGLFGVYISALWNVDWVPGALSREIRFIPSAGFRLFGEDPFMVLAEIGVDKIYTGDLWNHIRLGASFRWRLK